MPCWPSWQRLTAVSTACRRLLVSIPAMMKSALSMASGRSVLVRMQMAGKGWPTLVKKLLSSGRVPLSLTTAKACIWRLL